MQVAVLLALNRMVHLVLTSILALSRLDACLLTVMRGQDRGYASFLAMALMLHSFSDCLKRRMNTAAAGPFSPGPPCRTTSCSLTAASPEATRWWSPGAMRRSSAAPSARRGALLAALELQTNSSCAPPSRPHSPLSSSADTSFSHRRAALRWQHATQAVTAAPLASTDLESC
jgi:hypothetical protein